MSKGYRKWLDGVGPILNNLSIKKNDSNELEHFELNNPCICTSTQGEDRGKKFLIEQMGFPCGLAGKESTCNAGDLGSIPWLGRCPGESKCYPLYYSGLEKSMDCVVLGVTKSRTQLSDFHFTS